MQKLVVFSSLLLLVLFACNKDKFNTTPTLEIKSISPNPVPQNAPLTIELEYTDKEGDISDSIFIKKIRLNQRVVKTLRDSFWLQMPGDAPDKTKGTIRLTLDYQSYVISAENPGSPPNAVPDTLNIQIKLQDKAKNVSEPVETGTIVVLRQ
jgi:hypothetical protein